MYQSFWDRIESLPESREANVETWFVLPLLEALGYDISCIDAKVPVNFQQGRKKRPGRKPEADFVVYAERPFDRTNSLIVVEAKRSDESLSNGRGQGESYAQNLRAPILLMTNGVRIQIWQMQISTESALVLDCSVSDIAARRAEVESILSIDAVKAHCADLSYKKLDIAARDLGAYERAQHEQCIAASRASITRVLKEVEGKRSVESIKLISSEVRGALVVGPSGYGKTTLAASLLRECLERCWEGNAVALPVGVFLPDVALRERAFEEFLVDRIASHKPGFTLAAFRTIARERGLVVIADGFERVAPERRSDLETALRTLLLDYPRVRLFVMSRAQAAPLSLNLPTFQLGGYTPQELRELARLRSSVSSRMEHAFTGAPDHVYRLAEVPLIADLVLDRYAAEQRYAVNLAELYEEWIDRILCDPRPIARALDREFLEEIAIATAMGPITLGQATALCRDRSNSERALNSLAEADALSVRGATIELYHEGLADYLRAVHFWKRCAGQYQNELAALALDISSQFPTLLVATAPTADARAGAWRAIARTDIHLAIRCLRFAVGDETLGGDTASEAKRLLGDIQSTIEMLVGTHLQSIGDLVRNEIAGVTIENLGIRGNASESDVVYSFFNARKKTEIVELVSAPFRKPVSRVYGHALRRSGYGGEAGRVIGAERVQAALASLVKERRLRGERMWAEERVFGRLRHLVREYEAPVSSTMLQEAHDILKEDIDTFVVPDGFRSGQTFPMRELVEEIAFLIDRGVHSISPWWDDFDALDLHSSEGRRLFARTIDEYHRRRQLVYVEVVESSFPALAPHLQTFRMLPLKYEIEAEFYTRNGIQRSAISYRRWPVRTFGEAGADVTFPSTKSDWDSDGAVEDYVSQTDVLLKRFGRWFDERAVSWGASYRLLDLHGRSSSSNELRDESAVVRGAMSWLKRDLDRLFSEMPAYLSTP